MNGITILQGDALEVLRTLPDESVHCVVTSPPYWGLRDYGIPPSVWPTKMSQGVVRCNNGDHVWSEAIPLVSTSGLHRMPENQTGGTKEYLASRAENRGNWCHLCGAWRGCLGLEPTPELFVEHMVTVFSEVRRVLRADGTLWLNMGDSYQGGNRGTYGDSRTQGGESLVQQSNLGSDTIAAPNRFPIPGLKPKDLCGVPWMLAFALRADGWYLRSDIIWHKPNPMPESVTDRPTKSHEYIFLMSKSERYHFDAQSIREDVTAEPKNCGANSREFQDRDPQHPEQRKDKPKAWNVDMGSNRTLVAGYARKIKVPGGWDRGEGAHGTIHRDGRTEAEYQEAEVKDGRNKRSVWTVATQPFPEAHFATFPEELIKPCILAGCPDKCCTKCGAPWKSIVKRGIPALEPEHRRPTKRLEQHQAGNVGEGNMGFRASKLSGQEMAAWKAQHPDVTVGFEPTCDCYFLGDLTPQEKLRIARQKGWITPGTVLDPFGGSGTTALVARDNGCKAILIELNPEYIEIAKRRLAQEHLEFV